MDGLSVVAARAAGGCCSGDLGSARGSSAPDGGGQAAPPPPCLCAGVTQGRHSHARWVRSGNVPTAPLSVRCVSRQREPWNDERGPSWAPVREDLGAPSRVAGGATCPPASGRRCGAVCGSGGPSSVTSVRWGWLHCSGGIPAEPLAEVRRTLRFAQAAPGFKTTTVECSTAPWGPGVSAKTRCRSTGAAPLRRALRACSLRLG